MPVPLPRQQQNDLLQAYYDLNAFNDSSSITVVAAGSCAGMGGTVAEEAFGRCREEGMIEKETFGPDTYLSLNGRLYVEALMSPSVSQAPPVSNTFNGPVSNSQIASGSGIVQNQGNTVVDIKGLQALLELVNKFDVTEFSAAERRDFDDDIEVIEAQLASPSEVIPGYQRALRGMRTVMTGAAGSAIGGAVLEVVTGLLTG